mmetsp:Transcript_11117/g.25852  ORF Transcript_11117/g.25852 Transcript_11117/m.25852 type:complete len:689 (+) Transcript_11117:234-2300(+)
MSNFVDSLVGYLEMSYKALHVATALATIGATAFYFRYKAAIKRRKKRIQERLARGLVYRDTKSKPKRVIKALELKPSFVHEHASSWQLSSFGEYLSTLRFFTDNDDDTEEDPSSGTAKILERELYFVMASLLMKALGESVGAAILPVMGMKSAESILETIASKIVSYVVAKILYNTSSESDWDPTKDLMALPLSMGEMISFVNINQKVLKQGSMDDSPMQWMERGEIAYDPTYHTPTASEKKDKGDNNDEAEETVLIPNPFVVEDHFEAAILGLEERIRSSQGVDVIYDPDDISTPEPTPLNPTILPDLYLGWGDAKVTHTARERLRNRLFAALLTKLSHNYEKRIHLEESNYFVVRHNGTDCSFPDEFVRALRDSGHTIEVCPRSTITTFGMAACVKEPDGSWTNIPVAFFFRTGYESSRQRPAYFHALHGGIDMNIKGPLVGVNEATGKSRRCDIQFYMAIEGMCGWHSNHNIDAPWLEAVSTTNPYGKEDTLTAVRMCGIVGCAFNQIGTEMDLPFGGYGVLGVCNDTAAVIDRAIRGETNMYPLIATGRFLMHIAKFLGRFHECLILFDGDESSNSDSFTTEKKKDDNIFGRFHESIILGGNNNRKKRLNDKAASDTLRLASAACDMSSDIHCSPKQMMGAARRYASNFPKAYFQISEDSKEVMEEISQQYKELQSKLPKGWGR